MGKKEKSLACEIKGPGNFFTLRKEDYGVNSRQGTFGEQLETYLRESSGVSEDKIFTGNTAALYNPNLIIVQDNPLVREGEIILTRDLADIVNGTEIKGVRFSGDKSTRLVFPGFKRGWNTPEQIENNSFLIALTGSVDIPERVAEFLRKTDERAYILAPSGISQPSIRVPCFCYEHNGEYRGLVISGVNRIDLGKGSRYSFATPK